MHVSSPCSCQLLQSRGESQLDVMWLHLVLALKHECDGVTAVLCLHGNDVIVAGALEHLGHIVQVHAHAEGAVAAEVVEAVRAQHEGHQGHMGGVHGLQAEASGCAVEVGIRHQVLNGLQHLLQQPSYTPYKGLKSPLEVMAKRA